MKKEKIKNFLEDLSELTKKYNIKIAGCGCCGSPYLWDYKNNEEIGVDLNFDKNEDSYEIIISKEINSENGGWETYIKQKNGEVK